MEINKDRSENVNYDYPDFPVYIIKGLLSHHPNYSVESHWHDDIEMIAVVSGNMEYNINGEVIMLREGEGVFINSRQVHFGFSEAQEECEFICVLFHPVIVCLSESFEKEFVMPVLEKAPAFIPLKREQSDILSCISEMYKNRTPLITASCICKIWDEIYRTIDSEKIADGYTARLTVLKNMMDYVKKNLDEKITLESIADAGHVSKRTCGNVFKRCLNKTPIEYLTDVRLRKSIEMLKNTDMTILEISEACGFAGASYYAESFRRVFGKSPVEYRKALTSEKSQ